METTSSKKWHFPPAEVVIDTLIMAACISLLLGPFFVDTLLHGIDGAIDKVTIRQLLLFVCTLSVLNLIRINISISKIHKRLDRLALSAPGKNTQE